MQIIEKVVRKLTIFYEDLYTEKIANEVRAVKSDVNVWKNWLGANIFSISCSVYDRHRLNNRKVIFIAIIDYETLSVYYNYPEANYLPFVEKYKDFADIKNHIAMIYEVDWDHSNIMFGE